MKKRQLEENRRLYPILSALCTGYCHGNFSKLFPYLAPDCVWESQWVLQPLVGADAITDYLVGKGETLIEHKAFPEAEMVELLDSMHPVLKPNVSVNGAPPKNMSIALLYPEGKICLYLEQTLNDKKKGMIIDVKLDENGKAKRIDLCMPELFHFRRFGGEIILSAVVDDNETDAAEILLTNNYYPYLRIAFAGVGVSFKPFFKDMHIPMETWCRALECWKLFADAKTFDDAFETIAGVDYDEGTVARERAAAEMGYWGAEIWAARNADRPVLNCLLAWTAQNKDTHNYVNTN